MPLSLHEWFTNFYADTKVSDSQFDGSVAVVKLVGSRHVHAYVLTWFPGRMTESPPSSVYAVPARCVPCRFCCLWAPRSSKRIVTGTGGDCDLW